MVTRLVWSAESANQRAAVNGDGQVLLGVKTATVRCMNNARNMEVVSKKYNGCLWLSFCHRIWIHVMSQAAVTIESEPPSQKCTPPWPPRSSLFHCTLLPLVFANYDFQWPTQLVFHAGRQLSIAFGFYSPTGDRLVSNKTRVVVGVCLM